MNLNSILDVVTNKENFSTIEDYSNFCSKYLEFIKTKLQAVIISKNENHYMFYQYKKDGTYNITRPINSNLMLSYEEFELSKDKFLNLLLNIKDNEAKQNENRILLNNFIYTCQQSIGAALDALPAKKSNTARKINGDLFEHLILLIIEKIGIDVKKGIISVPVKINGVKAFNMNYQHDLIIKAGENTKAIGSVKTSSKDRIDKIFIDKFLYNKLTDSQTPHFAIFLNDVQRKGKENNYSINTTFLSGHFKGYTVKLNPLDGIYYFDIRPNMQTEEILKDHIKTFDNFLIEDIWDFLN
ncbi:MAG: hypothetical protein M0R46_15690 [Candidatus Muirbacterium halophilum]|nr:hypothetical protein [Candidatus Muirbacterium halophilum]MCK9477358.1 hypothetical protein [Candidatus Muirbacterium halophilum]